MDQQPLAQTLHRLAESDMNADWIGRIILSDVKLTTQTPNLTYKEIEQLWQIYYPKETTEERTPNITLIYFKGKPQTTQTRNKREPIIPTEAPVYGEQWRKDTYQEFEASPKENYHPDDFPANKPGPDNIIW
jgi:hypothetical protein